jgi:L-aminopeptidase/D-esterase-like protein
VIANVTEVSGVRVGHWTDVSARTGCTVVLLPTGTTASGEVRGGAPGTREWALLRPEATVASVNAVVLTGGSAFGLAACDGVVRWCEERGIGYPTLAGPVPIVVGMVLYDLAVGDASVRPGADEGYAACVAALASASIASGMVGAGTGATVGKWRGPEGVRPGGLGSAAVRDGDVVVAALMAVNAVGDLRGSGGLTMPESGWAGGPQGIGVHRTGGPGGDGDGVQNAGVGTGGLGVGGLQATTIGVIVTNAALDKTGCLLVAQSGHDGLARALEPVHTAFDGDALVAAATGAVTTRPDVVRMLAARAVEAAVRDALESAPT